jgi:hypothetical protein
MHPTETETGDGGGVKAGEATKGRSSELTVRRLAATDLSRRRRQPHDDSMRCDACIYMPVGPARPG